ncbi:CBS domain-containing protein [Aurantibacter crassamenti]|uniref:DUF294 nucleotidyltransferase-like domain-containing protein n=1 Tax=Aurantibacter crassamenti TaxID=1837375 RepID=UPI0019396BC9|nr:DUF294 nucleotidyltransferase-like domain-containing protein [Aurantibacter crassamenti]MBM1106821.1 CBS domain-containing protein [Aurantibacter crassamenti]
MNNTISIRVADFLRRFPPFNAIDKTDLENLAAEVSIVYRDKGSAVFQTDEAPHECFYVVHKGAVILNNKENNSLLDKCDEGDIFGLRPLIANENYKMDAFAFEESILYAIPLNAFRPHTQKYEDVGNFLIESFASNTRNPYSIKEKGQLVSGSVAPKITPTNTVLFDFQQVTYSKKIVSCTKTTTIQSLAERMTKRKVGAMLVLEDKLPIGIITDKDIRNKVATGLLPISAKASEIMTSPVITYPKKMTVAQAQMAMMKSNISHLCLTEDGTVNTAAAGILSKHDLMLTLGNNPAVLMKAIKRARKIKKIKLIRKSIMNLLQGYLDQNIPMTLTSRIISELNDACVKQVTNLSLERMSSPPPVKFSWISMGSQGRSEQLLHTDQDNALIFEDVEESELANTTKYFLKLAKHITKGLMKIGYEYCPAEMMGSNPKWCLSLSQWKTAVSHWIANPGPEEVLLSSIFFDYNLVYGEKELIDQLTEHIFEETSTYPIFFRHLASGALQNPSPSGFFRSFLVEDDGAHKDFFDLKRRALMPLVDAARLLILSHKIKSINNTAERFERLAELEPNSQELFLACSYATKALLKFRTKQGLLHNDSGRFIALDTLSKEEKIKLKRTFKTIKELQELIKVRFMVANLLG